LVSRTRRRRFVLTAVGTHSGYCFTRLKATLATSVLSKFCFTACWLPAGKAVLGDRPEVLELQRSVRARSTDQRKGVVCCPAQRQQQRLQDPGRAGRASPRQYSSVASDGRLCHPRRACPAPPRCGRAAPAACWRPWRPGNPTAPTQTTTLCAPLRGRRARSRRRLPCRSARQQSQQQASSCRRHWQPPAWWRPARVATYTGSGVTSSHAGSAGGDLHLSTITLVRCTSTEPVAGVPLSMWSRMLAFRLRYEVQ